MPHIVVKEYKEFITPIKKDDFEFLWFAKPLINARDTLVGASYNNQKFLLSIKSNKKDELIIKSDKVTRISPTILIKRALKEFCQMAECEILRTNINNLNEKHLQKSDEFLKGIDFFYKNFPKDKEIWIEIGFGSGRHLLYQAKKNPNILFIGIEIHKPSIEQVLKQIDLQNIKNILILDYDARTFLEFVPSNIVGKIFVHFPVPWDKKPHRRVISKKFINEAKRVLKKGGTLELRTDSKLYFDYSLELFLEEKKIRLEIDKNKELEISSKYEDRWKRLQKDIYDIKMINQEISEPIDIGFDFKFTKELDIEKIINSFDTKPKVYSDFFIHFEKIYQIDENRVLIKLSFGDFSNPEHRYIFIQNKKALYFGNIPFASKANIKSHQEIEKILNG